MRGNKTDSAVLCTQNKTFKLLEQDTSDTLLISPNLLLPDKLAAETDQLIHREVLSWKYTLFKINTLIKKNYINEY